MRQGETYRDETVRQGETYRDETVRHIEIKYKDGVRARSWHKMAQSSEATSKDLW